MISLESIFIKFSAFLMLCSLLTISGIALADVTNSNLKGSASKMLIEFCRSEFQHNIQNRYDLIKMTSAYEDKLEKLTQTSIGTLYIPDAYEIYAIKSYKILDLSVSGDKAVATVSYDVLAKRTGWKLHEYKNGTSWGEAVFVEYPRPNYLEKIKLIYDGKRWWVLDPPFPKISNDKVISFFDVQMQRIEKYHPEVKTGKFFGGAQDLYNADKRNMELLKRLAGK